MTTFRGQLHILGAGSIGRLWAASIRTADPSYPVTLLLRNPYRRKIEDPLKISWQRPFESKPMNVSLPIKFLDDKQIITTLVVSTKAHHAKAAVESVLDKLDQDGSSKIIILCNGALSVRDDLSKIATTSPLVLATTTHGCYQEKDKEVLVHAGAGKTYLEEWDEMAELWDSVGLNCKSIASPEMNQLLWKKLAANCVINPLTALFRCTNGELLTEPSFPELQQEILKELSWVARCNNQDVCEESLRTFVTQVIQDTRNNKSSMLQDVLKKQQTEVDHLNGYVVRKGREYGIECPTNDDVCRRIQALLKT